jgi:hypothetical protein
MAARKSPKARAKGFGEGRREVPGAPEKPERIRVIIDLMTSGRWVTRRTIEQLAQKWGLSTNTLDRDAAEASRMIRGSVVGDDELRAQLMATLQSLTQKAIAVNQLRTAVEAVRVLAGVSGAEKPRKLEHSGDLASFLSLAFEEPKRAAGTDDDGKRGGTSAGREGAG